MKAVLVLLVLALGAVAVRGEEALAVAEAQNDNVAFVPQAFDQDTDAESTEDMDADTAEEELLDADEEADNDSGEDDSESELEGDAETESEDAAEEDEEADEEAVQEFEQEEEADSDAEEEGQSEGDAEEDSEAVSFAELDSETDADRRKGKKAKKPKRRPLIAPRPLLKPVKFHSERIEAASTNKYEDPEMAKLNLALDAVKEDILSTNKQITDERKWVIAVAKIIASYNDKMKRVESHIVALRKEMKALYRKKKQIENLKLQKALEAKLREARDELATLTNSLKHVAVKQGQLNKSGADLRQTIAGIQSQLAKLRGQQLKAPRPAAKGRKGRKGRKVKGKGKRRCAKGKRYSKKAKKCVSRKGRRAGRR